MEERVLAIVIISFGCVGVFVLVVICNQQRKLFQKDVDQPPIDQIHVSISMSLASSSHGLQLEYDQDQNEVDVESVLSTSFRWESTDNEKRQRMVIVDSIIRKKAEGTCNNIHLPHEEILETRKDDRNNISLKDTSTSPVKDMLALWTKSRRVGTDSEISPGRMNLTSTDTDDSDKSESGLDPASGSTDPPLYSAKACPICRENYEVGDDICWSKNVKCTHAYHTECVLEWLLHNDECCLCKENFLICSENFEDDAIEGVHHEPNS
uniref:RING-type domain-containing protein n=1 Tax=Chaetoceros debilis TaxID=122233 RepID=A0A7S3PW28_9STRA|mmetsp:Transcript_7247/g.10339  ORF Transcript_7247/g.10339 Transcript_7247/m.10339 type:complete len:266 (+) Transcript_7247:82-879(+)